MARESGGHPLLLRELVEHERLGLRAGTRARTLDEALASRIESLEPLARQLLSLVALTETPCGSPIYARAMGLSELPREPCCALLEHGLVRAHAKDALVCAHERVRRAVLALLAPQLRATYARSLAAALSLDARAEASQRARLWAEAGERDEAALAYAEASERALEALAFVPAIQLLGRALALRGDARDDLHRRLATAHGYALARAGRSVEAAHAYASAAQTAEGDERVRLRISAIQHLIQGAQVQEGMRSASKLLAELGIPFPTSDRAALVRIGWEHARIQVRGLHLRSRMRAPRARLRLEALEGLATPLSLVSYLAGVSLRVQSLRYALVAGEPSHLARALAHEALWRATRSSQVRDTPLVLERARALAEHVDEPALHGELAYVQGAVALARTEYGEAVQHLARAHEILVDCPGQPWLLTSTRIQLGFAWATAGEFAALARHGGSWLSDAAARADRCAMAALPGYGCASVRHLMRGDPDAAIAELELGMRGWPDEPFGPIHFGALCMRSLVFATTPPGPGYLAWVESQEHAVGRASFMRAPSARAAWLGIRCGAHVHALPTLASDRRAAVAAALRDGLRALARSRTSTAIAAARWWGAVLHLVEGDLAETRRRLASIRAEGPGSGNFGALGADYALGLLDGADGDARCSAVLDVLRSEGWREPRDGLAVRHHGGLHLFAPPR